MFNVKWAELIRSFGASPGFVKLFLRVARAHQGFVVAIDADISEIKICNFTLSGGTERRDVSGTSEIGYVLLGLVFKCSSTSVSLSGLERK